MVNSGKDVQDSAEIYNGNNAVILISAVTFAGRVPEIGVTFKLVDADGLRKYIESYYLGVL